MLNHSGNHAGPATSERQHRQPFAVRMELASRFAIIALTVIAVFATLWQGRYFFAPTVAGLVVGIMLTPILLRLERRGWPAPVASAAITLMSLILFATLLAGLVAPIALWADRLPQLWFEIRSLLVSIREPLKTIAGMREQLRAATGDGEDGAAIAVTQESETLGELLELAPGFVGQLLIFVGTLYFYLATRTELRLAIMSLCVDWRPRYRAARIFRDVERYVSRYVAAITLINMAVGVLTALAMALLGMPSPALWGAFAMVLNYVLYLGPTVMVLILLAVSLINFGGTPAALLPPLAFLFITTLEGQFVTPAIIGRAMTLNPFLVFVSLAFWLWLWGPIGALVAVPLLIVGMVVVSHFVSLAPARSDAVLPQLVGAAKLRRTAGLPPVLPAYGTGRRLTPGTRPPGLRSLDEDDTLRDARPGPRSWSDPGP